MAMRRRDPFADRKGPFEHLWPRNMLISTVQACAFTAAPMVAAATSEENDELEVDMDKLRVEFSQFRGKALRMLCRVLSCTSLKRLLEAACVRLCSLKTAARLLKDPAKSALRKAARHGRLVASCKMLRTAAYATSLTYASNFLVEALLAWRCGELRRRTRALVVSFGSAYAFCTAGVALGSLLKPGFGTVLGAAFGDITAILLLENHPLSSL